MRQHKQFWILSIVFLLVVGVLVLGLLLHGLPSASRTNQAVAETTPSSSSQTCTPFSPASTNPSALSLDEAQPGLSQVIDEPQQYRVYGTTAAEIRNQIVRCAPSTDGQAEFTGETSYRLTWQYDFSRTDTGACTVSNPKIGLHVTMVLPVWQPAAMAGTTLADQWQTFSTNLRTHENGHVALDTQYAQTMLNDLRAYPASDCATIATSVSYMMQSNVNALNQANDNYDTATDHGATQGAILP